LEEAFPVAEVVDFPVAVSGAEAVSPVAAVPQVDGEGQYEKIYSGYDYH
jgi:hypothetical protein